MNRRVLPPPLSLRGCLLLDWGTPLMRSRKLPCSSRILQRQETLPDGTLRHLLWRCCLSPGGQHLEQSSRSGSAGRCSSGTTWGGLASPQTSASGGSLYSPGPSTISLLRPPTPSLPVGCSC